MREWSSDIGDAGCSAPAGVACLTEAQADVVAAALADFRGDWSLLRHEGCDGDLLLLVTPDNDHLATFTVDATPAGFSLATLRDDLLVPGGCFDSVAELIVALRHLVEAEMAGVQPGRRHA